MNYAGVTNKLIQNIVVLFLIYFPLMYISLYISIHRRHIESKQLQEKNFLENAENIVKSIETDTNEFLSPVDIEKYCPILHNKKNEEIFTYFYLKNPLSDKECKSDKLTKNEEIEYFHKKFNLSNNQLYHLDQNVNFFIPGFSSLVYLINNDKITYHVGVSQEEETPFIRIIFNLNSFLKDIAPNLGWCLFALYLKSLYDEVVSKATKLESIKNNGRIDLGFYSFLIKIFSKIRLITDTWEKKYEESNLNLISKQKKELNTFRTNLSKYFERLLLLDKITLPYDFKAIIAAADINDFSRIKEDKNALALYKSITSFLDALLHDLSVRFGASFCKFEGDMVQGVFYPSCAENLVV